MSKNKISVSQFFICMFLCSTFITFGFWGNNYGNNSLLVSSVLSIIGTILLILVCIPSYLVKKKVGISPINVFSEVNTGFSLIIKVIYLLSYFIFACAFLSKYVKFFKYQINREASSFVVILAFVLICAFGCYKGMYALFKTNTILFVFSVIALLFIFVGLFDKLDFKNINHVSTSVNLQISQGLNVLLLSILPLTTFVVFSNLLKGNYRLGIVSNAFFTNSLYFIITACVLLVFGQFTNVLEFPSYVLSKESSISVLKGGDGMMFALITVVTFLLVYLFSVSGSLAMNVKNSKVFSIGFSFAVLIVTSVAVYIVPIYKFITNTLFLSILAIVILVLIPTFSYVIIKINR